MAVVLQRLAVSCMGMAVVEICIQCEQMDSIMLHTRGLTLSLTLQWNAIYALPNTPVWFGTNSIPVADTLVTSVQTRYLYPTLR